ncbi:hypothetical protein [Streptomyces rhizosphaerihabitans]|nr:hypothetical protein [Streptomyces rhizosphaerihabitans]MCT9011424.1 hypothetical protein [Streptomyces rhizosphaerihabitans]
MSEVSKGSPDRLLHHAHIVLTEGSSLRLTQAASGQDVVPLNQPG